MNKTKLQNLIKDSEAILSNLSAIDYEVLKGHVVELESTFKEFKEGGDDLLSENDVLQIGIVGQVKAGKSSFLNSLFFKGENVLPKASTPMTAGLTVIEYADKNTFEVEYFDEKDWGIFVKQDDDFRKIEQEVRANNQEAPESIIRKEIENRTSDKVRSAHEMVSSCSSKSLQKIGQKNDVKEFFDIDDLQNVLEQYVGASGEFTSVVKSLYIKMNDEGLKGLRIVDTPGVNDPVVSRENRTRTFLHSCHGVFLLSASTDFLGSGDVSFLNSRIGGSGIGTVVLLASKFDSVLQDIGAEREMKHDGRGDLVDTVEMQKKKLKRRLRELSDTIDEKLHGKIKLDTTAGIGYSISKKPSDKWDDVEKQIVKQMQRYYPDYFSSDEDIKDYFAALANMDDIKTNYLDGLFVANKETIISEKINAFFKVHQHEIAEKISRILEEFKNRQQQLNETTVAEIERQKANQAKLFKGLQDKFIRIFSDFRKNLQQEVKTISNNLIFNEVKSIPTESTLQPITRQGKIWGHNTYDTRYDQVNCSALQRQIEDAVEAYAKGWNDSWKKLFESARKMIADKLNDKIGEFESQLMSTSFNDSYYRNLIDNVLDDLRDNRELKIDTIITDYQRLGADIASQQFSPSGTRELSDKEVAPYLASSLREHNKKLISDNRNLADSIKADVAKEVSKNLEESGRIIDSMKSSFCSRLQEEGEAYLTSLEEDLKDKKVVLEKMDRIIADLSKLFSLYA